MNLTELKGKKVLFLAMILVIVVALTGCFGGQDDDENENGGEGLEPIRVGVADNLEPASFLDENGEFTGFDIELTMRLAEHLNRPIEFVVLEMAAYASAVEAGQVDMVISNWIINPTLTGINFSVPYFDTPFLMVVRRDANFTTVEQLRTRHVAGVNAPIVHTVMGEFFPQPPATQTHFNQNMDMVAALLAGQIDGFMVSRPTSFLIERNNPELMVIQTPLSASQAGIGVREDNTELLEQINEFLTGLLEDGTIEEMIERWYNPDYRHVALPTDIRVPRGN